MNQKQFQKFHDESIKEFELGQVFCDECDKLIKDSEFDLELADIIDLFRSASEQTRGKVLAVLLTSC